MDTTVHRGREAPLVNIDMGRRMVDGLPDLLALTGISPVVRVAFPGGHVWIVCDPDLVRLYCSIHDLASSPSLRRNGLMIH